MACAAAAEAYATARLAGHPVIALLVGKAMSGAFLAHAPILVALAMRRIFFRRATGSQNEVYEHAPARARRVDRVNTVLWGMGRAHTTLLLWTGSFFTNLVLFLMLNWLPSLIVGLGFSRTEASLASIASNLSGSVGAASLGRLHAGGRPRLWVIITYGGIAVALWQWRRSRSLARPQPSYAPCSRVRWRVCSSLAPSSFCMASPLSNIKSPIEPPVGAAIAAGRLGSVLGAVFAAALLATGAASATVLAGTVPFVLFAGGAVLL